MNEYKIRKAVITGGSGGVGIALIQKLISENVEVVVFQRKDSKRKNNLPKHKLLKLEYCSLEELKDYCPKETGYDVFFHLGWANTQRAMRNNIDEQNKNVIYSCYAVEAAHKMGCHTFIGAGSQAEYGRCEEALSANTLCRPETAYGVMKLCACYTTKMLCERYHIRHIWTRILSGYGKFDNPDSMLISNIINSIEKKPLAFSKGEQIWDFVYMDDIAEAMFLLAQKGESGEIYPIGSGEARPLKEYIHILCEKLEEDPKAFIGKIPYSDKQIMHLEADISKLYADTGWLPKVSFEEGIERVIEFEREKRSRK